MRSARCRCYKRASWKWNFYYFRYYYWRETEPYTYLKRKSFKNAYCFELDFCIVFSYWRYCIATNVLAKIQINTKYNVKQFFQNLKIPTYIIILIVIFPGQWWRSGTKCDCKCHRVWVRSQKYLFIFIFSLLRSGVEAKSAALSSDTHHAMPAEFGGNFGTEYLNIRFPLPNLLCAGYSVNLLYFQQKRGYSQINNHNLPTTFN